MNVLPVFMYVDLVCLVPCNGQKRATDSLELELSTSLWLLGTEPWVSLQAQQVFLIPKPYQHIKKNNELSYLA